MKLSITKPIATALATALLLAACSGGHSSQQPANTATPSGHGNPTTAAPAADPSTQKAAQENLPQPDPSTPASAYVKVNSGNQLMFLYWANAGLPPDYKSIASAMSNSYRTTSDEFRKHDLMKALKPKITAKIADAKAHPYVVLTHNSTNLGHYDFQHKGFPTGNALFGDGGSMYFFDNSTYELAATNGSDFHFLDVKDDKLARKIESMVSHYHNPHMKIFAFVQSTSDSNSPTVNVKILKVQLIDKHGSKLFEQDAK